MGKKAGGGYYRATCHPWPCWLFLLPLLFVYEGGVVWLGGPNAETLRNGADHWLRRALMVVGLRWFWVPPALLTLIFIVWMWARRQDRPGDLLGVLSGMVLESVAFALGLWALSRILGPALQQVGVTSQVPSSPESGMKQILPYLGAGIYEEALFRLGLYTLLFGLFRLMDAPNWLSIGVAAVTSAILFSAAHHLGPYGQTYSNSVFLFRLAAGLYFAALYETRGIGIAVGAHACYNIMVSIGV
jgi:membrane protease YdiL (CAAX protease family)